MRSLNGLRFMLVIMLLVGVVAVSQPAQAAPLRAVVTYTYTSAPNKTITDAFNPNPGVDPITTYPVSDTINVPDMGTIVDVNVTVDITHPYVFDLKLELAHAGASTVLLIERTGDDCNDLDLVFDDEAGGTLPGCSGDTTPYPAGTFQPLGSLSNFDGLEVAGGWTLMLVDEFPIEEGTLNSWKIEITFDLTAIAGNDGAARIADGRENSYDIWATAAIYCNAAGVDVYAIDAEGHGSLAFRATPEEIAALGIPAAGSSPDQMLVKEGMGIRLYRLPDGQFQVNAPADGDANGYVFIWGGCGF